MSILRYLCVCAGLCPCFPVVFSIISYQGEEAFFNNLTIFFLIAPSFNNTGIGSTGWLSH